MKNTKEKKEVSKSTPAKGSNWKSMKKVILKNPVESRRKALSKANPEKTVGKQTKSRLEEMLNPDGKGTNAVTPVIAIDCEMVGIGLKNDSALARVSIVNFYGSVLYDTFVKPPSPVTDYRTKYSGIRPEDLEGDNVVTLREAQDKVCKLMKNRVVVGHAISNDFAALFLKHPRKLIRDTASYEPLTIKNISGKRKAQKLQILFMKEFGIPIQEGEHNSVDDARAALLIYKKHRIQWEEYLKNHKKQKPEEETTEKKE